MSQRAVMPLEEVLDLGIEIATAGCDVCRMEQICRFICAKKRRTFSESTLEIKKGKSAEQSDPGGHT
jgi:hypothetical protein